MSFGIFANDDRPFNPLPQCQISFVLFVEGKQYISYCALGIKLLILHTIRMFIRDEKDHRSGPKTRTGPDSGPSPRPKKIENNNPEKTDRTRTGLNRTGPKNRRFSTIFICYF